MKKTDILKRIDHTELRPNATKDDYERLMEEALTYGVASVCVPPNRVIFMKEQLPQSVRVCTVVGFPNGYNTLEIKAQEAKQAIACGADEIDMVIDISTAAQLYPTEADLGAIKKEIKSLRHVCCQPIILKVIIETCYLTEAQKVNLCYILTESGVDYIKTSTGFGPEGATLADIELFRRYLGPNVKIKAAGGIATIEQAKAFLEAGCERIGSSKLVRLLAEVEGDEV